MTFPSLLTLLALAAAAQTPSTSVPTGWFKQASSLLFFDSMGSLATEVPLEGREEAGGGKIVEMNARGGVSPNHRFGWTLELKTVWNTPKTKLLESKRLLRFYGNTGKELWSTKEVDVPDAGEPVAFAADGETFVLAAHWKDEWFADVKSYVGNTLHRLGPFPRLKSVSITPNGRYALARWEVPDKSSTHTFLELPSMRRKDIDSGDLFLGAARMEEDGKIFSGRRLAYDFSVVPSSPSTAPESPKP